MTKWEYNFGLLSGDPEQANKELDAMGAEGWELVQCEWPEDLPGNVLVVTKRPLIEQPEPLDDR